jgi:hypothetical protein
MNKDKLKAVHDDDLDILLERLGIIGKFTRQKLKCSFCKTVITKENLHSIFPRSGSIKFVCDNPECVVELSELLREGKVSI